MPRVSQLPGFVTGHWVRLDENHGTSTLVFESEEAARQISEEIRPAPGGATTIDSIQVGEVVERA